MSTDKLFTTITSNDKGIIIKRYHKEEESCQVGEIYLDIEVDAE